MDHHLAPTRRIFMKLDIYFSKLRRENSSFINMFVAENVYILCRLGVYGSDIHVSCIFFAFFFRPLTYIRQVTGLALELVDATAHLCVSIVCSSFEYIINCIIYEECNLDINILDKFCSFSYHWIVLREIYPLFVF